MDDSDECVYEDDFEPEEPDPTEDAAATRRRPPASSNHRHLRRALSATTRRKPVTGSSRRTLSATQRSEAPTRPSGGMQLQRQVLRRHASATERRRPKWDDRHHLAPQQEVAGQVGGAASDRHGSGRSQSFVGLSGGAVKAVVDSARSGLHVAHRMRQQPSRSLPSVDKGLPWKDPRRAQRRRPLVDKPPFMRSAASSGRGDGRSPPRVAAAGVRGGEATSVRDLARANQLRRLRRRRPRPTDTSSSDGPERPAAPAGPPPSGRRQRRPQQQRPEPKPPSSLPQPVVAPPEAAEEIAEEVLESEDGEVPAMPASPPSHAVRSSPAVSVPASASPSVVSSEDEAGGRHRASGGGSAGRRPRPACLQLGGNGGLSLNMPAMLAEEDALEQTYEFTSSGVFNIAGFEIKEQGLTRTPVKAREARGLRAPENLKRSLVKLSTLGRGASGIVTKRVHAGTLALVAVKTIPCFEQEKRHQMLKELRALHTNALPLAAAGGEGTGESTTTAPRATCPYIVGFYDAFINPDEGNVSIVMEYMDGGSLQDVVEAGGCASEATLANIAARVLEGLSFLHANRTLHRDIKPSNLLINHRGEVKITDFGIAAELESTSAVANSFVGTLTFMSPERIAGGGYALSSDIWSFGLSLMACALGRFPIDTRGGQ